MSMVELMVSPLDNGNVMVRERVGERGGKPVYAPSVEYTLDGCPVRRSPDPFDGVDGSVPSELHPYTAMVFANAMSMVSRDWHGMLDERGDERNYTVLNTLLGWCDDEVRASVNADSVDYSELASLGCRM